MGIEIISERPINSYELKKEIAKIKKRDGELNFRAQKTEDHLEATAIYKDAPKLFKELDKLKISRLRENYIQKITDVMPTSVNDLKVLLQGYTVSISAENMKKIVEVVVKHTAQ